jgi:hypothetical protein
MKESMLTFQSRCIQPRITILPQSEHNNKALVWWEYKHAEQ